jgi:hypothetical protein
MRLLSLGVFFLGLETVIAGGVEREDPGSYEG